MYHGLVARLMQLWLAVLVSTWLGLASAPARAEPHGGLDRLERFTRLVQTRLATPDGVEADRAVLLGELYELLDAELLDSLASAAVLSDPAVLADRLEALTEAWGGARVQVVKVRDTLAAAVRLVPDGDGNSLRVYRRAHGEARRTATITQPGIPTLYALPRRGRGDPDQVLAVWEGQRSSRGTTPLAIDLVRLDGAVPRTVWTTSDRFDRPLETWDYSVRLPRLVLRYELRYSGWLAGCDGQTEGLDVYRYAPRRGTFVLESRQTRHARHRDLHQAVDRVLAALSRGDARALATLVREPAVRARLPQRLQREPACDATDGDPPGTVSVAARADDGQSWSLVFRRARAGWRLWAADRVLE